MSKFKLLRDPFPSELAYFKKNPHVSGMATEDSKVILNPFTKGVNKSAVYKNEAARLHMRKSKNRPSFELTPMQRSLFKDYGSDQDKRETIAARILTSDPSIQDPTQDQMFYVRQLERELK